MTKETKKFFSYLGISYIMGIIIRGYMILTGKHTTDSYLLDFIHYTLAAIGVLGTSAIIYLLYMKFIKSSKHKK